jgi:cell division protein FtsL
MSLKLIARDLYRLQREVEALESKIQETSPGRREILEDDLRKLKAERNRMRRILDGAKDDPPCRRPM